MTPSPTLALLLLVPAAGAADWTGFRGPGGSAVSDEKGLPVTWGPDQNVRWKVPLPGRGLSNPVITGGKVFVTACSGYKQSRLHVLCFALADGKKLWERQFAATGNTQCNPKTNMAAPTPVTDGRAVYALFATGDLAALDLDGNLLWYRSLVRDYPDITNQVGLASSPVVAGKTLLLALENAGDSFAAGLDAATGQNKWKLPRARTINWVTPLVLQRDGRAEAVFQTEQDVTAYDPETGKEVWSVTDREPSPIASPVLADGLILVPGREFLALRPGKEGQTPEVVWKSNKLQTGYASPVYHQGKVYVLLAIGLRCADARTGKELWTQRVRTGSSATPVIADGRAYVTAEDGNVTVIQLGDQPKVLAVNEMKDTLLATPAVADGALFFRSDSTLYCVGAPKK
jgi:outer membrane protein assembly factor BamB